MKREISIGLAVLTAALFLGCQMDPLGTVPRDASVQTASAAETTTTTSTTTSTTTTTVAPYDDGSGEILIPVTFF